MSYTLCKMSVCVAIVFMLQGIVLGAEIHVPDQFPRIQDAVNAASHGDMVVVAPGRYIENINFLGKNITVSSANPDDPAVVAATVIDGSQNAACVTFSNLETENAVISGFTLMNGKPAVFCSSPAKSPATTCPTIQKNVFRSVYCGRASATIAWNTIAGSICFPSFAGERPLTIVHNTITSDGAGIEVQDSRRGSGLDILISANRVTSTRESIHVYSERDGQVLVAGNSVTSGLGINLSGHTSNLWVVTGNTLMNSGGVSGAWLVSDNLISGSTLGGISNCVNILNNVITGNSGGEFHVVGGIRCDAVVGCLIQGNTISGNVCVGGVDGGGGIYCHSASVIGNVITGNKAAKGGGIYSSGASAIIGNIIEGNEAMMDGGGVYGNCTYAEIIGNVVVGNLAANEGGAVAVRDSGYSGTFSFAANTVVGNRALHYGAIRLRDPFGNPVVAITDCIFASNLPSNEAALSFEFDPAPSPEVNLTISNSVVERGQTSVLCEGGVFHWGPNNIDTSPLFVYPGHWNGGKFVSGDYHLLPGSTCIDSGSNDVLNLPGKDIVGIPRIIDGNGDGTATVDIGAYEYLPGDVNNDGKVNVLDLLLVRNSIGRDPASFPAARKADLNNDGKVNVLDLIAARNGLQR